MAWYGMFRVVLFTFSVEKVRQLEKSTPAVLVALVTNYSYGALYVTQPGDEIFIPIPSTHPHPVQHPSLDR